MRIKRAVNAVKKRRKIFKLSKDISVRNRDLIVLQEKR